MPVKFFDYGTIFAIIVLYSQTYLERGDKNAPGTGF
jgi:hypothetical protein